VLVGDEVALKVLFPRFLDSPLQRRLFQDEARAAARLSHPNVVTVFDASIAAQNDVAYIAMELLTGRTLKALLKAEAPLPPATVIPIMVQVCDGLSAAHAVNVIHRDLKPDNIFLEALPNGQTRVKLVDFGIAAMLDADPRDEQRRLLGTLRYMAPEQARNEPADARVDLYALGVVLYEALTRKRATGKTISAVINDPVVPPNTYLDDARKLPAPLEALLLRLLAKSPAERPASALEARAALLALEAPRVVPAPAAPPIEPAPPAAEPMPTATPAPLQPSRTVLFVGLFLAILAGGLAALLLGR
jgi:serine/threonine-protein kinase